MKLKDWRFESLRLTTFHQDGFDIRETSPWQLVLNESPESMSIDINGRQEAKPIDDFLLSCKLSGNRVDWFYSSKIPLEGENGGLGEAEAALSRFQEMSFAWLEKSPIPIVRIALGGIAFVPVASKREGYDTLDKLLPSVALDPDNSRDFQYRINRPRGVQIGKMDIIINRISTWSVRRTEVRADGVQGKPFVQVERASCELDINSSADSGTPLNREQVEKLSSTIIDFGIEILERGDVA